MDGVQYSISMDNGKTAVIRDVRTLGLTSENPALWEWMKELLGESGLINGNAGIGGSANE
jgi:hypothetical protein